MTKNKTAICTPTATREEFESILMELDTVGVKWLGGERPLEWKKYFKTHLMYDGKELALGGVKSPKVLPRAEFISAIKADFGKCEHRWTMGPGGEICTLCSEPRYDTGGNAGTWTSAEPDISKMETTGDGPKIDCSYPTEIKEIPKMNYNKMTKAELIEELKKRGADISQLEWYVKDLESKLDAVIANRDDWMKDYGKLKKINSELLEDTKSLEKTNAEQAETIENIRNRSISIEEVARTAQDERDKANSALRIANAKLEKQTASISKFFADVLEGK